MRRLAQSQTASPGRGVSLTRGQLECQRSPTSWTTAYSSERCESAYVRGHIPRAYHVELRPAFAAWVGWVVPFGTPIIFVSDAPGAPEEAVRQLRRIGHDELPGYLEGGRAAWEAAGLPIARTPVLTMREVRERLERKEPLVVLDIRQDAEWAVGHLPQARHIEAGAIAAADLAVAHGTPLATHCEHGQRSATALSVLERRGFGDLRLITDGLRDWQRAGGPVVQDDAAGGRP